MILTLTLHVKTLLCLTLYRFLTVASRHTISNYCFISAASIALRIALRLPCTASLALAPGILCPSSCTNAFLSLLSQRSYSTSLAPGQSGSLRSHMWAVGKIKGGAGSSPGSMGFSSPWASNCGSNGRPPQKNMAHLNGNDADG